METKNTTIRVMPAPAFIAVDDYKQIIQDTNNIRARILSAENFVKQLHNLKNEEERSLEKWRTNLEDMEKKLAYIDHLIERAEKA